MKYFIAHPGNENGIPISLGCKPNIGETIFVDDENGNRWGYEIKNLVYMGPEEIWLVCHRALSTPQFEVDSRGKLVEK